MITNIKEKIKYWLIPQGWQNLYKKMYYKSEKIIPEEKIEIIINEENIVFDLSLANYKDKHMGKRVFILASGPSINTQDLLFLKNEYCIAVSQFFLHPQINEIHPLYHCFAPTHYPFNDETNKIIFDNFISNYKYPVKLFIGNREYEYSYYNFLKKNSEYKIDASFIDYSKSTQLDENNYTNENIWDITQKPFEIRTVVYIAIQIAYYMGFNEIYLLGVDHDYLRELNTGREGHHFYAEEKSYNDKEHLNMFTTERWFEEYYYRWKQYRLMNEFLKTKRVKIFNATNGGMIDVFERVDYNRLFNK